MKEDTPIGYPYIPNSVSATKKDLLCSIGANSIEDLYADIPQHLRFVGKLNVPEPFLSEYDLKRHVLGMLDKNKTTSEYLNFLGAGCYQHFIPAVCDEINQRGEFLTAYSGKPYIDHGRFQALFEYASMMGELLNMDIVNVPMYDGFQAASSALRMASPITNRSEVILSGIIDPDKLSKIQGYLKPDIRVKVVVHDFKTGLCDLSALRRIISPDTAAVYIENPNYMGGIEIECEQVGCIAHENGSEFVVYVDPISLGVLAPPADYGADLVCGDIQTLGMHMNFGGGQAGFVACHDNSKYIIQYPSRLFGIIPTRVAGEYGFENVSFDQTSLAKREGGNEWVGTGAALWGITAGVFLALMGPQGMVEIGEGIIARLQYTIREIRKIPSITIPFMNLPHFKEFAINFDGAGKSVKQINQILLQNGIFGGKDLSEQFPLMGQCALYCITEVHRRSDIDKLVTTLREAVE